MGQLWANSAVWGQQAATAREQGRLSSYLETAFVTELTRRVVAKSLDWLALRLGEHQNRFEMV